RLVGGHGVGGDEVPLDGDARGVRGGSPHAGADRVREFQVGDEQVFFELGGAGEQAPVGVDDEGAAVEDEFVLAADEVDVGDGGLGFAGPPGAQPEARVAFAALVWGAVDDDEQPGFGFADRGDGSAVLPQVFADDEGDVDAVEADDGQRGAGHEVAGFVEHPVVGQVVFGGGEDRLPLVEERDRVVRGSGGLSPGGGHGVAVPVQVADGDGEVAEPGVGEPPG